MMESREVNLKSIILFISICAIALILGFVSTGRGLVEPFLFILIPAIIVLVACRLIYGVYLLLLTLPYFSVFTYEWLGVTLKISDYMALLCIVVFLVKFALRPKETFSPSPVMVPLGVFVIISIIIFFIHYPGVADLGREGGLNSPALRSVKVILWTIYSALIAVTVASTIKTKAMLRNCLKILLFSTVIACIYSWIGLAGFLLGIKALTWKLVGTPGGFVRMRGTFGEPNYFAHYMALILPLALMTFIFKIYRFGFWGPPLTMFVLFFTNIFIFSTTGMLGLILMIILIPLTIRWYGFMTARETMRYMLIFAVTAVLLFLFWLTFAPDFSAIVSGTLAKAFVPRNRYAGVLLGIRLLRENFITGVGPGNWDWFSQKYIPEIHALTGFMPSFNNLYLEILLDTGIIGFIPFIFIFITLFKGLSRAIRKTGDIFLQAVCAAFMVGFVILLVEYATAFNFYRIYIWVPLGIAMAAIRLADEEKKEDEGDFTSSLGDMT